MIYLGRKSKIVLSELTQDLQRVILRATKITPAAYDFSLVEGHRPVSRQYNLYLEGRTKIDGKTKKGSHNYYPSKGVDIYPYLKGYGILIPNVANYKKLLKFFNMELTEVNMDRAERFVISRMAMTSGFIYAAASIEKVDIIWGTDWDRDGNFLDHNFQDYPHFQEVLK